MDAPICAFSKAKGNPRADHIPSAMANMVLRSEAVPTATIMGSSTYVEMRAADAPSTDWVSLPSSAANRAQVRGAPLDPWVVLRTVIPDGVPGKVAEPGFQERIWE